MTNQKQPSSRQTSLVSTHAPKSRVGYIILAIMFGMMGGHNFYAKRTGIGLAQAGLVILAIIIMTTPIGLVGLLLLLAVILWVLIEILVVRFDGNGVKMNWAF